MKVWVLIDFRYTDGRMYYTGSQVTLPHETEAEQIQVGQLITYGIVSVTKPDGVI